MDLLGYPLHWRVTDEPRESGKEIVVSAETLDEPTACPRCHWFAVFLKRNGTKMRQLLDAPIRGKHVRVRMRVRRFVCTHCGHASMQPVRGVQEGCRLTDRLVRYVGEESLLKTFLDVAQLTGVSLRAVRDIFAAYGAQLDAEALPGLPRVLSVDGVYVGGVERFNMVDAERRLIVNLLPTVRERALCAALMRYPDRRRVEIVVSDMSHSFRRVSREVFPGALHSIDPFHVCEYANDAVDAVRKRLRGNRKRRAGQRMMIDRKLLRKHPRQLSQAQRADLDWWLGLFPELKEAYEAKEAFYAVWESSCPRTARARYSDWLRRLVELSEAVRAAFAGLTGVFERWDEPIFNYFEHRFSNGFIERMNGEIKKFQLLGKGYSFEAVRVKAIFGQMLRRQREEQHESCDQPLTLLPPADAERATRTLREARREARRKSARESESPNAAI